MPAFSLPFFVAAGASTDRPDLRLRARIAACASLAALWRADKQPFDANSFHAGRHGDSARIHEITTAGVKHLPCDRATFNFGKNKLSPDTWGDLGQGGARFFSHLNSPISFNTTPTP